MKIVCRCRLRRFSDSAALLSGTAPTIRERAVRSEIAGGQVMGELERIIARRSELDPLAEELAKQLPEVRAEREELLVAERVLSGCQVRFW